MKKILILIFTIILVVLIYNLYNKKNNTLFIGDDTNKIIEDKMMDITNSNDYRLMDLINDISDNKIITYNNKEYRIQNLLIKADKIIISIGSNDIKSNYDYLDSLLSDIENLFILIRKYSKEKIYIIGYKENNEYTKYLNSKLKSISKRYNIEVILY